MKILAFFDLHCRGDLLEKLVARANKPDIDVVVMGGDISIFGECLHESMKMLSNIKKPVLVLHGNHESADEMDAYCEQYKTFIFMHKNSWEKDGIIFLGYGGDGFSRTDAEFRKVAREWRNKFGGKKLVLLTHGPPYGTKVDLMPTAGHVGNKDYSKAIERLQPKLVLCGHIHETEGLKDKILKSTIINVGWKGMVLDV